MVGSVVCFSIMDICVKWLNYYPVGQVLFLRFFIGFIPIFFIIPREKLLSFYKTSRPGLHAFRAFTGAAAIIALFIGLRELPLADVVSLTFGGPIFVTVASFIPLVFCLLKPQLLRLDVDNLFTILGFIFPLHFFLNFKKTELAAATLIC